MTKREVVRAALDGKAPPYVPWSFGFTEEAREKLVAHFGRSDLEDLLGNHFYTLGSPRARFEPIDYDRAAPSEANQAAFEHARKRSLDARNSWPHQTGFGERRFDLVFSCGNFGHLPEPGATVEKARSVLKPDGLVCVAREPLAAERTSPQDAAPVVYAADALKRLFTDRLFSFVSEEGGDGRGTFWFRGTGKS